jgi:hypothetical protein
LKERFVKKYPSLVVSGYGWLEWHQEQYNGIFFTKYEGYDICQMVATLKDNTTVSKIVA